ncbi:MAG: linear amide C-N hydrolase [Tenuifilaceae bacterium]
MSIKSLLVVFLLLGCSKENIKPEITKIQTPIPGKSGIQKIDNFPFYIMYYVDDYHFDEYLETGTYPVFAQNTNITETSNSWACTCFAAMGSSNSTFFGRNFDWNDCIPLLLVTKPENGYSSVSMVDLEYLGFNRNNLPDNQATNNRLKSSPYLPFDGMNEKGVAIGMMAIPSANCTVLSSRITIEELEVIRLVLDFAANVDEAIQLISKYNIRFTNPPIHYMIADKSGKSAIIEFINGEMKVIPNNEPWQVCTNFIVSGTSAPNYVECWRYNKVYNDLNEKQGVIDLTGMMNLTKASSQTNTIWSMVYDTQSGKVYASISKKYGNWFQYDLLQ